MSDPSPSPPKRQCLQPPPLTISRPSFKAAADGKENAAMEVEESGLAVGAVDHEVWIRDAPGQETMTLTTTGVKASRFKKENDARTYLTDHNEQPDYTIVAFNYETGDAKYFAIFVGPTDECARWLHRCYKDFVWNHKSALELIRDVPVKLVMDIDQYISPCGEEGREEEYRQQQISSTRKKIHDCVYKYIYYPLMGGKAGARERGVKAEAKESIRYFQAHRELPGQQQYKVSFHVICRSIAFENLVVMKQVVRYMLHQIDTSQSSEFSEVKSILDIGIYSQYRLMRLLGSWKNKDNMVPFQCVDDQASTHQYSDSWASACEGASILTLEMLKERLPGFREWLASDGGVLERATGSRVMSRGQGFLNAYAEGFLNAHFNKQGVRYTVKLKEVGGCPSVVVDAYQNNFCVLNPAHTHDQYQGGLIVNLGNLAMTLKCFGSGCGSTALNLQSSEGLTSLRLAVLQGAPFEAIGVHFTDEHVLRYLPEGPWRVARTSEQTFLVSEDTIIIMYGQDVKALSKGSLEGADAAWADDKNIILALLNRDELVELLPQKGLPVLDPAQVAKLKDQFEIAMALFDHYVEPLFAAREIFVGPDLVLYERTSETPFLYVPIDMKRWSREDDKKASDPLRRWVANEIELRASKVVKDLWKKTSKVGWGHLQDKIDLATGIKLRRIDVGECYSFSNGVLFLPTSANVQDINQYFESWATMTARGRGPVLPLVHFDVDFDPTWATDRGKIPALVKTFETQGFSEDYQNHIMAFGVGRPLAKWALLEGNDFDGYQVHTFFYGSSGSGKSTILNVVRSLVPASLVKVIEKGRTGLGALQPYQDGMCRLMIAPELHNGSLKLYKDGFDLSTFNQTATGEPCHITRLYDGKGADEVINAPLLAASNNRRFGWLLVSDKMNERRSFFRRLFAIHYTVMPGKQDQTVEKAALSVEQRAAALLYGLQQYFKLRAGGFTQDDLHHIPEVAVNSRQLWEENSAIHMYFKWSREGEEILGVPRVIPKMGSYITPTAFRQAVKKFMEECHPEEKSLIRELITVDDIRNWVPLADTSLTVAWAGKDQQAFCPECFDGGRLVMRGSQAAGDAGYRCNHKSARTKKFVPNGSIINADLQH